MLCKVPFQYEVFRRRALLLKCVHSNELILAGVYFGKGEIVRRERKWGSGSPRSGLYFYILDSSIGEIGLDIISRAIPLNSAIMD